MISAQTPLAFVASENRFPLFRIMLYLILAVGGELLLQRRKLGKGRVGIDLALTLARAGARGKRPQRRPAFAPVTPALVAAVLAALIATAALALAAELALLLLPVAGPVVVPALVVVAALAFERRARTAAALLARRRSVGARGFRRCTLAGLAKILVAIAPPMLLALRALARRRCSRLIGRGGHGLAALLLRTVLMTTVLMPAILTPVAVAVVTRTSLFRSSAGPPDFDQLRLGRMGVRTRSVCGHCSGLNGRIGCGCGRVRGHDLGG